jgi:predicted ferric reductase
MARLRVREFTAVDMAGRARLIAAEFVGGAVVCTALGIWIIAAAPNWPLRVIGIVFLGGGINYVPLAIHAILLLRPGRLDSALDGVDVRIRRIHYSRAQAITLIPLLVVVYALLELWSEKRPTDST